MIINSLKFKHLIAKKNLTQRSVASELSISKSNIASWISREKIPNEYIKPLNKVLEIDLEQYFNDDVVYIDPLSSGGKPQIPFYGDVDIMAGDVEFWNDPNTYHPTAYYHLPDSDAELVLPVFGNSMATRIEGGDKIAVKQIKDLSYFNYGLEYVIITEDYRLVKQIRKHKNPKFIILHSHNTEEYDDIDLPIKKILSLFVVVEILKKNQ